MQLKKESTPLGQYKLHIDDYVYHFETLDDACKHLCDVLKSMNLISFWNKGVFEKTRNLQNVWKTKIYKITIHLPKITFKIHYRGTSELLEELVLYTISKYIK